MGTKLRELIRRIRNAKTLQEERSIVAKESAAIRTDLKSKNPNKPRNVAKLMYIHMLGYDTRFGQLECINLITSPNYPEKRVGYLALVILLDEEQEVLPLIEHSLKKDLNDKNQFIQALALTALGNIGSADICQDLCYEVEKLLLHSPYVRKKAALCAVRIVQKNPDLAENFVEKIGQLLKEHNHGVLLTTMVLMEELIKSDPEEFRPKLLGYLKQIVSILKSLVMSAFVLEHDVQGIADPFLQIRIIRLLRLLGQNDQKASQRMTDILAQVATNTEDGRNPGNAILYECANTILAIESEKGLRDMAINIFSKFLINKDNNLRFVSLNSLQKVIETEPQSVFRHTNTIMDCLLDHDVSIRKRAVDLLLLLVTEKNYEQIMEKFVNYLTLTTQEEKEYLTGRIGMIIDTHGSPEWKIQSYLSVILVSGRHTRPQMADSFIALLTQTEYSHSEITLKLYQTVSEFAENPFEFQKCNVLLRTCVWCIGEFGESLTTVDPENLLRLLVQVLSVEAIDPLTRSRALTAVVKLSKKFPVIAERCYTTIQRFKRHVELELQSRACEYSKLLKFNSDVQSKILADHPPIEIGFHDHEERVEKKRVPREKKSEEETLLDVLVEPSANQGQKDSHLLSFLTDDLPTTTSTPQNLPSESRSVDDVSTPSINTDDLLNFFDTPSTNSTSNIDNLLDLNSTTEVKAKRNPIIGELFTVLSDDGPLKLEVEIQKPDQLNHPERSTLVVHFSNAHPLPLTNVDLRVKAPKYLKMRLFKASSENVGGHSDRGVHQKIQLINSLQGQKRIILKYQIVYTMKGNEVTKDGTIDQIPARY